MPFCADPPETLFTHDGESLLEFDEFNAPIGLKPSPERRAPYGRTVVEAARWMELAKTRSKHLDGTPLVLPNGQSGFANDYGNLDPWVLPDLTEIDLLNDDVFDGRTYHNREWWKRWKKQVDTVSLAQLEGYPKFLAENPGADEPSTWLSSAAKTDYANSGKLSWSAITNRLFPFSPILGSLASRTVADVNQGPTFNDGRYHAVFPLTQIYLRRTDLTVQSWARSPTMRQRLGWWKEEGTVKLKFKVKPSCYVSIRRIAIAYDRNVSGFPMWTNPNYNYFQTGNGLGGQSVTSIMNPSGSLASTQWRGDVEIDIGQFLDVQPTPFSVTDVTSSTSWIGAVKAYLVISLIGRGGVIDGRPMNLGDVVEPPTDLSGAKHWYPLGPTFYDPLGIIDGGDTDVMSRIKVGVDALIMG